MQRVFDDKITERQLADESPYNLRFWQRLRAERKGPPFIRLGRTVFYRREAVRDWLEAKEQEQPRARVRGVA